MSALGDIVANYGGLIQTGPFGSQLHEYEYTEVGVPVVMPKDIASGKINFEGIARIPEEKARQLQRHKLQAGDIVFPRRGDIGKCAFVSERDEGCLCGTGCLKISVSENVLLPRFLFYFLGLPESVKWLENNSTGSTMMNLNANTLGRLEIPDLPVEEQRRIADILSAYDDLIENNRRRIAILEETARLTYRKWFGGHNISADGAARSRHEVTKGGRGSVRAKTTTLGDVAEVLYGKDHKKIPDGAIPIFGSGGVMRYGATAIFDKPSVLIPRKGTIGNVMYVDEPFWTVDTMFYTRFKLPNMEKILYYQLCDYNLASMSTGAAVPSMTTAILNSLEIKVPPDDLRVEFDMAVEPMFVQKRLLKKQNASLAAARDMLLPRLMKGQPCFSSL